jgi:hypothetical protein
MHIMYIYIGAAESCYDISRRYVMDRSQFGAPLASNQVRPVSTNTFFFFFMGGMFWLFIVGLFYLSFVICMLTLFLMPLTGLHFCVRLCDTLSL